MKYLATSAAIVLALASTGNAQDASQWAGVYVGLTTASNSGDMTYDPGNDFDLDGNNAGVILGYNFARGPWVFGGEFAYFKGRVQEVGNPNFGYESWSDLKARGGYAFNNVLVYGTLGTTFSTWDEGGSSYDGTGLLYGVGAEYLVTSQIFVGAEYLVRDMKSDWDSNGEELEADVNTISLRVGMKF